MTKVSIYCFHHPPHNGVGGRRWMEFANRLSQKGYDVTVTCAPWYVSDAPASLNGVKLKYLQRSRLRRFPFRETRTLLQPLWVMQKLLWRLQKKGYADQTDGLVPSIRRRVRQDVQNGVHHVIVSCAPFHWALHVGRALSEFAVSERPQLLLDFRDPWSSNDVAYFNQISDWEKELEFEREKEAWCLADQVLVVEDNLVLPLNRALQKHFVLPNGASMSPLKCREVQELGPVVRAVYFGSLYSGCLERLVSCLLEVDRACAAAGKKFKCTLGGRWTNSERDRIAELECCEHHGMLTKEAMFKFWGEANFGISIVPDSMSYAINTKILECVSMKKPLLLVAKEGVASQFIVNNNLGMVWDSRFEILGAESLGDWIGQGCPIGPGDGHMGYDVDRLVERLEAILGPS